MRRASWWVAMAALGLLAGGCPPRRPGGGPSPDVDAGAGDGAPEVYVPAVDLPRGGRLALRPLGPTVLRPGETRIVLVEVRRGEAPLPGRTLEAELEPGGSLGGVVLEARRLVTDAQGRAFVRLAAVDEGAATLKVSLVEPERGLRSAPARLAFLVEPEGYGALQVRLDLDPVLPADRIVTIEVSVAAGPRGAWWSCQPWAALEEARRAERTVPPAPVRFETLPSGATWTVTATAYRELHLPVAKGCVEVRPLRPGETRSVELLLAPPPLRWGYDVERLALRLDAATVAGVADGVARALAAPLLRRLDPEAAEPTLLSALRARGVYLLRAEGRADAAQALADSASEPAWETTVRAAWAERMRQEPDLEGLLRSGAQGWEGPEWYLDNEAAGLTGPLLAYDRETTLGTWRAGGLDGFAVRAFSLRATDEGLARALLRSLYGFSPASGWALQLACERLAQWFAEADLPAAIPTTPWLWRDACTLLASDLATELEALLRERGWLQLHLEAGPADFPVWLNEVLYGDEWNLGVSRGERDDFPVRWRASTGAPLPWLPDGSHRLETRPPPFGP